jgi:isomerase DpgB
MLSSASSHDTVTADERDEGDAVLAISGAGQPTPELIAEVEAVCARIEDAPGNPVVVLRLGRTTLGDAPRPTRAPLAVHVVNRWERALRRLERLDAVTLAVAEGSCGGPALEALLSCDYRIGTLDLLLSPPILSGEPWPGMVLHRLAHQLGVAKVRQLALFGTELPAMRAAEVGLVDEITDDIPGALAGRVALARKLTGSEVAIRRRLLLEAASTSFEDALGTHLAACDRTLRRAYSATW